MFTALSTRPYQHFIKNLNPDNAYHIRILAYNAVGPGDYCSNSGFDCDGSALVSSKLVAMIIKTCYVEETELYGFH